MSIPTLHSPDATTGAPDSRSRSWLADHKALVSVMAIAVLAIAALVVVLIASLDGGNAAETVESPAGFTGTGGIEVQQGDYSDPNLRNAISEGFADGKAMVGGATP